MLVQVVQQETVEGVAVLLGCMLGVLAACSLVTIAACLVCPACPAHGARRLRAGKQKGELISTRDTWHC